MAFLVREYDRLEALRKKWGISRDDMFYAVENGLLRTCVWLPLSCVERGVLRSRRFIYESHQYKEGFIGVRPQDCRLLYSNGRAKLRIFNSISKENHIIRLAYEPPQPSISVRLSDLVVLKKDREQFEENYEVSELNVFDLQQEKEASGFVASEDYRYIKLDGQEFHFGDVQARVIELLHDAAQSNRPWVHGKTLIHESGSNAIRFRDLFKNKKDWHKLIISNERGYYRLNIPLKETMQQSIDNSSIHYREAV